MTLIKLCAMVHCFMFFAQLNALPAIMVPTVRQIRLLEFPPTATTPMVSSISTNYSSALTSSSSVYSRIGSYGTFYYETIEVTTTLTGSYSFLSSSAIDTYGYLYLTSIDASDLSYHLLTFNDDNGGNLQFLFNYTLQAGSTYIVVFTTFGSTSSGSFSLGVYGPRGVSLRRINLSLGISSTTARTPATTPTATTPMVSSISTNYSSALTSSSSAYSRIGSYGTFYYETIEVTTTLTGSYSFLSSSAIDTYGYLYLTSIDASDLSYHLLTFNDDNGGNLQFLFTYNLQAGSTYIVIFTTFSAMLTGSFSLGVYGPSGVNLRRIDRSLGISSTTPSTTLIPTTPSVSSISTNYSSALTNSSAVYVRMGSSGPFYYEAIEVTATLTGSYTFLSSSRIDTYGFLYLTSINPSDLSANLLTFNDDSGGNFQFLFTYNLQAGSTYIVVFTTFSAMLTGSFSLGVYGPSEVSLRRIDVTLPTVTTSPGSSTIGVPSCLQTNTQPVCPAQAVTNARVVTVNPAGRSLVGNFYAPNNTVFNLNDPATGAGYLQSVTVQYNQTRLPSASARVWIYGIVVAPGSFIGCSQYLIPAVQISSSQMIQTYNLPVNVINVAIGTFIGVGVQDTAASIAATWGGAGLRLGGANLSASIAARSPLFFSTDNLQLGAKISYTLIV